MSFNSPAKHERVQRHLMRQRGAGSRSVNADFGFSFAGFSVPSSQDATPSDAPCEPPMKRRRTSEQPTEQVEREEEAVPVKTSALDRRGRTKAARAKRRFVVEEEDEGSRASRGEENSFADGLGSKKAVKEKESKVQETLGNDSVDLAEHEKGLGTRAKHKRAPKKGRAGTRSKKVERTSPEPVEEAKDQPEPVAKSTKTTKSKRQTAAKAEKQVGTSDVSTLANPTPKRTLADGLFEEAPPPRKPRTKRTAGQSKIEPVSPRREPEPQHFSAEDLNIEPAKELVEVSVKPKRRTKAAKATGGDAVEQHDAAVARKPRKRKAEVLHEEDKLVPEAPVPAKKSRNTTTKTKTVQTAALEQKPPRLERRPLQEGDVNRSPSSKKSPEKAVWDGDGQADGKTATTKAAKRVELAKDAGGVQRLRPEQRVKRDASTDEPTCTRNPKHEAAKARSALGSGQEEVLAAGEQSLKPVKAKQAKQPQRLAAQPSKGPNPSSRQPAVAQEKPSAEDEDIDWLFHMPKAPSKAGPKILRPEAAAKPTTAPSRKTKLVEIDLDDVIANVAAYAHKVEDGPGNTDARTQGGAGGGKGGRKGRKK